VTLVPLSKDDTRDLEDLGDLLLLDESDDDLLPRGRLMPTGGDCLSMSVLVSAIQGGPALRFC